MSPLLASASRRLYAATLITTTASALLFLGARAKTGEAQLTSDRRPFTVEYLEVSTGHGGSAVERQQFWAQRSDGSLAYGFLGAVSTRRRVINRSERSICELADGEMLKSTTYAPAPADQGPAPPQAPNPDCHVSLIGGVQAQLVGEEEVLGMRTYHYLLPPSVESGIRIEAERWAAPDLSCFDLKRLSRKFNDVSGESLGIFERKPIRVVFGEPEQKYFDVPGNYREVKPSELEELQLRSQIKKDRGEDAARAHVLPPQLVDSLRRRDEQYLSRQKK